ncbi:MAG: hypothetical protein KDC42_03130 [Ignavibacteriae bacterium]|nr:hypothetical protein [Ignavibacteriota bacterium]
MSKNKSIKKVYSISKIKFRPISFHDITTIAALLTENISKREFTFKVLSNQLFTPEKDLKILKDTSDRELIKFAKGFLKKENYNINRFKNNADFFKNFYKVVSYRNKSQYKKLQKSLEPIISHVKDIFEQQSLVGIKFKHIFDSLTPTVNLIAENIKPFIDTVNTWAEQNRSLFQDLGRNLIESQNEYTIAEKKAVKILQKHKWLVSPNISMDFIHEVIKLDWKPGKQKEKIKGLFIDYFSKNNWENLNSLFVDKRKNPIVRKRLKIINDCIIVLKTSHANNNPVNAILPSLISQIDGFLTDYLKSKNISGLNTYSERKNRFRGVGSRALTPDFNNLAYDFILEIFYQKSIPGKPLKKPFNFNRHKIMHGENVRYGRKDYLIRAFLILDFLFSLK